MLTIYTGRNDALCLKYKASGHLTLPGINCRVSYRPEGSQSQPSRRFLDMDGPLEAGYTEREASLSQ